MSSYSNRSSDIIIPVVCVLNWTYKTIRIRNIVIENNNHHHHHNNNNIIKEERAEKKKSDAIRAALRFTISEDRRFISSYCWLVERQQTKKMPNSNKRKDNITIT